MFVTVLIFILAGCGSSASDDASTASRRDDWGMEATDETTEVTTEVTTEKKTEENKTEEETTESKKESKASSSDADKSDDQADSGSTSSSSSSSGGKLIVLDPGHSNVVTGNTEPLGSCWDVWKISMV